MNILFDQTLLAIAKSVKAWDDACESSLRDEMRFETFLRSAAMERLRTFLDLYGNPLVPKPKGTLKA